MTINVKAFLGAVLLLMVGLAIFASVIVIGQVVISDGDYTGTCKYQTGDLFAGSTIEKPCPKSEYRNRQIRNAFDFIALVFIFFYWLLIPMAIIFGIIIFIIIRKRLLRASS